MQVDSSSVMLTMEKRSASVGTFITDVTLEELQQNDAARGVQEFERTLPSAQKASERSRAASRIPEAARSSSRVLAECSGSLAGSGELTAKLVTKSKSLSSLTGRRSSKPKADILHAKAFSHSKSLKPALFQHKESNYYDILRAKPGNGWFRALYEQMSSGNTRLTRTLLSVVDVAFVETLCIVNYTKMLVRSGECGLSVSIGEDAMGEFMQYAQAWNVQSLEGHPIVVQKKSAKDPSKGCDNRCVLMDLVDLQVAMQQLNAEDDCVVFQRFVPPKVRGCPSVVRIAWRDSLAPRGFRLKSSATTEQLHAAGVDDKIAKWTVSSGMPGTQATELRSIPSGAFHIADQISHFTQTVFGLQLTQLVVDCLQDEYGVYYFCQVKAFTAQPQWLRRMRSAAALPGEDWANDLRGSRKESDPSPCSSVPKKRPSSASSKKVVGATAACSMCTCNQPLSKLGKRMTVKMMLETEHHMRKRGLQLFHVSRVRRMHLSDLSPVCDACWSLYLAEAELCCAEARLAKSVGIDICGDAADEAYVPFGGVLSAVRSEKAQADYGGVHKMHDPFRIHNPLLPMAQPQLSQSASTIGQGGPASEWPSVLRQGGEALAKCDIDAPVTLPVPSAALQWRMMIHINRLADISPELRELVGSSGRLVLRLEVPWQPETPQDTELQAFGTKDDQSIHRTAVHFIFSDPASHHPLHAFLSQSMVRFSLLLSGAPQAPRDTLEGNSTSGPSVPREVLTGTLSLERMLESVSGGFLAQTWVMFCKAGKSLCQLKLTLGLVCDHTVPSEYVALRSYADGFVPSQPYFSSEVLPPTWMASIQGNKSYIPTSGLPTSTLLGRGSSIDALEEDTRCTGVAEAVQRDCPALLGCPLLLAPRPAPTRVAETGTAAVQEAPVLALEATCALPQHLRLSLEGSASQP